MIITDSTKPWLAVLSMIIFETGSSSAIFIWHIWYRDLIIHFMVPRVRHLSVCKGVDY